MAVLAEGEEWVMDGGYSATLETRLRRADHIIYLAASRLRCFRNVVRRWLAWRGRSRPDLGEGCPEQIDLELIVWVLWRQRGHRARTLSRLRTLGPDVPVTVLPSPAAATELLGSLQSSARG